MPPRPPTTTAEVALDLGSWFARAAVRGNKGVLVVPSVVAIGGGPEGRQATAIGADALPLLERPPTDARVSRPVRLGVVEDWEALDLLLRHLVQRTVTEAHARKSRALVAVPADASETERRALQEAVRAAGFREARLVRSDLAGAVGAQLPLRSPTGAMLVTVGAGRTEAAVYALGGSVVRRSVRVAGEAMDTQLAHWLRRHHNLLISPSTAERIKLDVGAARPPTRFVQMRVGGRDLASGGPMAFDLHGAHVAEAITEAIGRIRDVVQEVLRDTPPELCADLLASGVFLAGGSAHLDELDGVLRDATGLPILRADHPESTVIAGLTRLMDDPALLDALDPVA